MNPECFDSDEVHSEAVLRSLLRQYTSLVCEHRCVRVKTDRSHSMSETMRDGFSTEVWSPLRRYGNYGDSLPDADVRRQRAIQFVGKFPLNTAPGKTQTVSKLDYLRVLEGAIDWIFDSINSASKELKQLEGFGWLPCADRVTDDPKAFRELLDRLRTSDPVCGDRIDSSGVTDSIDTDMGKAYAAGQATRSGGLKAGAGKKGYRKGDTEEIVRLWKEICERHNAMSVNSKLNTVLRKCHSNVSKTTIRNYLKEAGQL